MYSDKKKSEVTHYENQVRRLNKWASKILTLQNNARESFKRNGLLHVWDTRYETRTFYSFSVFKVCTKFSLNLRFSMNRKKFTKKKVLFSTIVRTIL